MAVMITKQELVRFSMPSLTDGLRTIMNCRLNVDVEGR